MRKKILPIFISLLMVFLAYYLTYLSGNYIYKHFQKPPVIRDLVWDKLPYYNVMWISEICLLLSFAFGIYWVIKKKKYMLLFYGAFLISFFHILRAGLIILTPMGFPYEYDGFLNKELWTQGAFPSGHLSVPYLIYMITGSLTPLLMIFCVGITLLISRSHYSIDLVGTLLLGYPLFKFAEKYVRKYYD